MTRQPRDIEQTVAVEDPDDIVWIVSRRLKDARTRSGMSQSMLAERMGVKQTYIYAVESGSSNCTIRTLDKMAEALNVDIRELFPGPPLAAPTGSDLIHLFEKLDSLVTSVKEYLAEEKHRAADEKRRTDTEIERRRKGDISLLNEIQNFAEMRDKLARVLEGSPKSES